MAQRSAETVAADHAACRELIRRGSRSFYAASLLLPPSVRAPSYALYAFCRLSDDAVDAPAARRDAVDRLRDRLDRVYAGRPLPIVADRAFADMVATSAMPRALPEALLDGLAWDAAGRRYRTLSELQAYGARVAATVGAMMTVLMGVRERAVLARACDLGVAMQLTNIARDVGEDARNGRIYLPLDWLEEAGIDADAFLRRPVFDARLAGVVRRLLGVADDHYRRSISGVGGLPVACRPAIHAARLIYREIGRDVARAGHDSVSRRAVVPTSRKLALIGSALGASISPAGVGRQDALPETRFLVDAVVNAPVHSAAVAAAPSRLAVAWQRADARVARVVDLFIAMERRQNERGKAADGLR
jgi:phytoene synthase